MSNINDFRKTTEIIYALAADVLVISNTCFYLYNRETLGQIIHWLHQNFIESNCILMLKTSLFLLKFYSFALGIEVQPNQHYQFAENVSNFCSKLYYVLVFANIGIVCLVPLIVTIYLYATNDVMSTNMWILPAPS